MLSSSSSSEEEDPFVIMDEDDGDKDDGHDEKEDDHVVTFCIFSFPFGNSVRILQLRHFSKFKRKGKVGWHKMSCGRTAVRPNGQTAVQPYG